MKNEKIVISLVIQGFGFLFAVATVSFFTKIFTIREFGFFSYFISLITIISIPIISSVADFSVKEISISIYSKDYPLLYSVINFCIYTAGIISAAVLLLLFFMVILNDSLGFNDVVLIYLSVLVVSFVSIVASIIRGLGFPVLGQVGNIIIYPCIFLLVFCIGYYGEIYGADLGYSAIIVRLIAGVVSAVILVFILRSIWPVRPENMIIPPRRKGWVKSSFDFLVVGSLGALGRQINILLLAWFSTFDSVAEYRIVLLGITVFEQMSLVGTILLQSRFAQSVLPEDSDFLKKTILKIYGLIFVISIIGLVFYFFIGKSIISLVFGEQYISTYFPVGVVMVSQIVNLLFGPVGIFMTMKGRASLVSKYLGLSLVLNISISLLLIEHYGVLGSALGYVFGVFLFNILLSHTCKRDLQFDPSLVSALKKGL